MTRRLLLISNSTQPGQGYLEHCETELRQFLTGVGTVLFVPYALHDVDSYTATVRAGSPHGKAPSRASRELA